MRKTVSLLAFLSLNMTCVLVACGDATSPAAVSAPTVPASRATEGAPTTTIGSQPITGAPTITEGALATVTQSVADGVSTPTVAPRTPKQTPTAKATPAIKARALAAKSGDSPDLAEFALAEQKAMPHSGSIVETYYVGFVSTGDTEPYHLQNFVDVYKDANAAKKGVADEVARYIKKGFVRGTMQDAPPADANIYVYAPPAHESDGYAMIMQVGSVVSTVLGFGPPNYGTGVASDIQRAVFARAGA